MLYYSADDVLCGQECGPTPWQCRTIRTWLTGDGGGELTQDSICAGQGSFIRYAQGHRYISQMTQSSLCRGLSSKYDRTLSLVQDAQSTERCRDAEGTGDHTWCIKYYETIQCQANISVKSKSMVLVQNCFCNCSGVSKKVLPFTFYKWSLGLWLHEPQYSVHFSFLNELGYI